jgi:rhamnose utilization protein RhaD (predicted bifunctional aldolase and dehydrogenase)
MKKIIPEVEALVALSHHYGTRWEYVIAGGGNTSWKNDSTLWVKGSGQALGTIQAEGFARMDRKALAALWSRPISSDPVLREKEVLEALMAARLPGEESKRPSVETLLHDLLPFDYVVHTHPTMINALTCSKEGPEVFQRLFALEAVWIAYTDPGYVLAHVVKQALEAGEEFPSTGGFRKKVKVMRFTPGVSFL